MDLINAMKASGSGLRVQSARMKVISENIANADSVLGANGQEPYRRQVVFLQPEVDRSSGTAQVKLARITQDFETPFKQIHEPTHPLADENGFVLMPNVNTALESADMREAARSYEANLSAIDSAKQLMLRTMDIMR